MTSIRNKERTFRILKYLYENTDKEHPVSTMQLVKIFLAEDAHAAKKKDRRGCHKYRQQRMCNTEKTKEASVPLPDGFSMDEYVQEQFHMSARDEVEVVLECRDDKMK